MIIIKDATELKNIISEHHLKNQKIGKLDANYNKMLASNFYLHQGHVDCVKKLRENGCDVVILEFINSVNCFKSINEEYKDQHSTQGYYLKPEKDVLNDENLINMCKELNVDYLFYNSNDYAIQIPLELKKSVNDIIQKENYKDDLQLDDDEFQVLKVNLIVRTFRNLTNVTYIKSYKDGAGVFALKHYLKKYLGNDLIVIEPTIDEKTKKDLSSSDQINYSAEDLVFINIINRLKYDKKIINTIKECAKKLNLSVDIKEIINKKYFNGTFIEIMINNKYNIFSINKFFK